MKLLIAVLLTLSSLPLAAQPFGELGYGRAKVSTPATGQQSSGPTFIASVGYEYRGVKMSAGYFDASGKATGTVYDNWTATGWTVAASARAFASGPLRLNLGGGIHRLHGSSFQSSKERGASGIALAEETAPPVQWNASPIFLSASGEYALDRSISLRLDAQRLLKSGAVSGGTVFAFGITARF